MKTEIQGNTFVQMCKYVTVNDQSDRIPKGPPEVNEICDTCGWSSDIIMKITGLCVCVCVSEKAKLKLNRAIIKELSQCGLFASLAERWGNAPLWFHTSLIQPSNSLTQPVSFNQLVLISGPGLGRAGVYRRKKNFQSPTQCPQPRSHASCFQFWTSGVKGSSLSVWPHQQAAQSGWK